jgi:hypothetical protein
VLPATVSHAELWLDQDYEPTGDTIHLLIAETACASGKSPEGRTNPPTIVYRPDAILVLLTITRLPGPQDCLGRDPDPYLLTLSEPLGNRTLLDAGFVPPAVVTTPVIPA